MLLRQLSVGQQQSKLLLQRSPATQKHIHRSRQQCHNYCSGQQEPVTMPAQQQMQQLPPPPEGFRPNVGMCVFHPQKGVFAALRLDTPGKAWQMPQGGIDPGEDPEAAALRELAEETCITSVEVVAQVPRWLTYEFPTEVRCRFTGSWAQYKGQAQRWFLLKFTGNDSEVNLDTEHREFSAWRWMPLEQLPGTVIDFKRDVYSQVVQEFQPMIELHKQQSSS